MSNALLCSGDLYLDRLSAAGASTGFLAVSNATQLAIGESSEMKTLKSRKRANYGQALASVALHNPATVKLTLNEINRDALALALLGDVGALAQTGETVSGETVIAVLDKWLDLANYNLTADAITVGAHAEGTDYLVNRELGMIMPLSSGAIAADEELSVGYTTAETDGHRISGSTNSRIACRVKLDGENLVDGSHVIVTIDKAILTPEGEVDFLSEDFATLSLSGEMETVPGQASPYRVDMIASYA